MIPDRAPGDLLISLSNVGVYYWRKRSYFRREKFWALKDVSLNLREGESLGVIGRNGAGKTTLLQLLANIIRPDRGEIMMKDCRASLLSLQIGFVPYLTGRENAYLSGMLLGLTREKIREKMDDIIRFAELEEFIDHPVGTYSSGMRARLGFAVAFQIDPEILLIDEVLGVGDADFKEKSETVLREKIKSNKTVVLVSHNAKTVRDLCDRAVWIEEGETRAQGDVASVLQTYEDFRLAARVVRIVPIESVNGQNRGNIVEIYKISEAGGGDFPLERLHLPVGWRLQHHKDLNTKVVQFRGREPAPLRIPVGGRPITIRFFQYHVGGRVRVEYGANRREMDLFTDRRGGTFVDVELSYKPGF